MKNLVIENLGENRDYQSIWDYQEKYLQEKIQLRKEGVIPYNHLLFVEHPPVYTLGKSGKIDHLLANESLLQNIGATFVKTNRGGDITFHGPGQQVGYPIFDLEQFKTDIHWYMRSLEEVIIQVLNEFNLKGERSKGETGVWLDVGRPFARKICAMGVKASRWVSMHGFALNINTDLQYFEYIIPCGIKDKAVTSMQRELGETVDMELVRKLLTEKFQEVFEIQSVKSINSRALDKIS